MLCFSTRKNRPRVFFVPSRGLVINSTKGLTPYAASRSLSNTKEPSPRVQEAIPRIFTLCQDIVLQHLTLLLQPVDQMMCLQL